MTGAIRSMVARRLVLALLFFGLGNLAVAAQDRSKSIVTDDWELVERIDLPNGMVQLRVKPKDPAMISGPVGTKAAPTVATAVPAVAPPAAKPSITTTLADLIGADLSVPSSPAMAVLGMTGTEVQRPAFPRDFAASLVRGFDSQGKAKNAIALDIVPVALFAPKMIVTKHDYATDYVTQLMARTTVSLASSQVEGDSDASQLAAGIRVGLYDKADPGLYAAKTANCIKEELLNIPPNPDPLDLSDKWYTKFKDSANKTCRLAALEFDLWAKPALYVGYAQGWYSASGAVKDADSSAKALWASYSTGFGRTSEEAENGEKADNVRTLLQLYLARRLDERVEDPADADQLVREDRSELIARVRFGKKKWHGYIDGGFARVNTAGAGNQNVRRLGLGFEYQLRDDLWLVAGSVRETGFVAGDRKLVSTGLRFGQAPTAILAPTADPVAATK